MPPTSRRPLALAVLLIAAPGSVYAQQNAFGPDGASDFTRKIFDASSGTGAGSLSRLDEMYSDDGIVRFKA